MLNLAFVILGHKLAHHHCVEANYLLTSPKVNLFVIKNVFIDFLRLLIHVNIKLVSCTYCYFANLQPFQKTGSIFTLSEVIYNMTRYSKFEQGCHKTLNLCLYIDAFYTKPRAFLFKYAVRKNL